MATPLPSIFSLKLQREKKVSIMQFELADDSDDRICLVTNQVNV